jgi:hypothetical protein
MSTNVSNHSAVELTRSKSQLMPKIVEDVKIANGQDIFQTMRELNVSQDHSLSVTASASNLKTDTLVNNAHMVKNKTQETHNNASQLHYVTLETKSLVFKILLTAITAEPVNFHLDQDRTDQSATDQDQLAHVPRNTLLMVTAAFHALMDKSLMMLDLDATQLQPALEQEKFLEPDKTATDATLAHQTLFQTTKELLVLDQSQSAHALKDTLLMDMNAKNAQSDKLLIQTTTRDVSHNNAMTDK